MAGQSPQQQHANTQPRIPGPGAGSQLVDPSQGMGNAALADQVSASISAEREREEAEAAQRSGQDELYRRQLYLDFGFQVDEEHPITLELREMMAMYIDTMASTFGSTQARLPADLSSLVLDVHPEVVVPDQFTGYNIYGIRFGALWRDIGRLEAASQVLEQEDLDEVRTDFEEKYNPPDVDAALASATIGMDPGQSGYAMDVANSGSVGEAAGNVASRALGDALPAVALARDLAGMGLDLLAQAELQEWAGGGDGPREDIRQELEIRVSSRGRPGRRRRGDGNPLAISRWGIESYLHLEYGHRVPRDESRATMSADD